MWSLGAGDLAPFPARAVWGLRVCGFGVCFVRAWGLGLGIEV